MPNIHDQLALVHHRISKALEDSGRKPDGALLLAVSKTKPAADVRLAFDAGQRDFGENYLQEALDKQQQLKDLAIVWHFIGPIQSNKTRAIAENFDWVHSVDRVKIATRLNDQRPAHLPPLNVCLQVNVDNEPTKSGVLLSELPDLLESLVNLPHICVRGFMAIPAPRDNVEQQRQALLPLAETLQELQASPRIHALHPQLDTLSMGMSGDLEAAIAAGSTMVRVGTDIFGKR
ncbi:YggS family pyridoxal phosphate-dependent enzyme [Aestuariicella hydrocarbonica]|uniref:Pyridoxal phosphate homeostasis protein n=1 Tax=Pseudomaricurvus hydrocarbonicus TaxID=1470433 RepID=A0A9E5T4D9_9GAMM|nr:YggS family pyridoxal phosphate-dependent enzyme [Aestuariicella hydrocarbonica]NHO67849.1 YggS family pyridoxal phosphate-dependent enzyme [Aestuariicella hydrocarbonica]